jgi:Phage terminase large subunit (GpA)
MPWQQYVADVALEVLPSGLFAYRQVVVTVPRQSGKTTLDGSVLEHRALITPGARCWVTMQTGKDASDWLLNEHVPMLAPLADRIHVRRAAGSNHVKWYCSGGMVRPFAPTPAGLHSKTADLVVADEVWSFDLIRGRQLDQAIVPTMATKPNAQVWKVSTAGDAGSVWWLATVEAGRAAAAADRRDGLAFFEWSCPMDLDCTQEDSWPLYHPAYGRTIGKVAMTSALEQLGPDEFARAYGNQWVATTARVIPLACWRAASEPDQPLPQAGHMALGFDVALDRSDAAILACWSDPDGTCHLEVSDYGEGASWVAGRVRELRDRWRPTAIAYDQAGPALDVADELERDGVTLMGLGAKDYAAACSGLLEALTAPEGPKVRYRPHQRLDEAAAGAVRRALGDSWAWGRRQSNVSLAPLTAATVARWGCLHSVPAGPFRIY